MTSIFTMALGVILTVLVFFLPDEFARALGSDHVTLPLVSTYIKYLSIFTIPFMFLYVFDVFLKNDGFPLFPVICTVGGSILNVILDYVLILKLQLVMLGAAIATGIAELLPMIILGIFLFLRSSWKLVRPIFDKKSIGSMFFNGASEGVSSLTDGITGYIFNIIIMSTIGRVGVVAFSVANYAYDIASAVFEGIVEAIDPGVTYNIGAKNYKRVLSFRKVGFYVSLFTGIFISLILVIFGRNIADIFIVNNPQAIELAIHIIYFYAIAIILDGVNTLASSYYTAVNRPVISIIVAFLRSSVSVIIGLLFLPKLLGDDGIWVSLIFAETLTIIYSMYCFKKYPY